MATTRGGLGPQGFRGLKGDQGPTGPQGLKGDQGIQGTPGLQGNTGPVGPDGQGFKIFNTGDVFPDTSSLIINGDFSQSTADVDYIIHNTNIISNNNIIPGWNVNTIFLPTINYWGYPPFLHGANAISLQRANFIEQTINLNIGTYVLSFWLVGRPGGGPNPIAIKLNGTIINTITPPNNKWTNYSVTFTIYTPGNNVIRIAGTSQYVDLSSALQAVSLINQIGEYYLQTGGNLYMNAGINNGNTGPNKSYVYSGNIAGPTGPQGLKGDVGKGFVVYKFGDEYPVSADFIGHDGEFYLKKGGDMYCYIPGTLANETTGDLLNFKYVGDVTDESVLKGTDGEKGPTGPTGSKGDIGQSGTNGRNGDTGPQGPAGANGYDSYVYITTGTTYDLALNTTTNKVVNVVNMTDNFIDVMNGLTLIKTIQSKYTYASFINDTTGWNIVNI